MKKCYLAIDLGATSGRGIVGYLENGKLETVEVNRFANAFVPVNGHLFWNIYKLFDEILNSIQLATQKGFAIQSIGIDTWGVDFGLINEDGYLTGLPYIYRDSISDGAVEQLANEIMPISELYTIAGIQTMQLNSVFQLFAQKKQKTNTFLNAKKLLFTPDLLNYLLTGVYLNEYTIASTSSLLNCKERNWDGLLLSKFGIEKDLFSKIVFPGDTVGRLTAQLSQHLNVPAIPVIAVASHDTASAVAAIPAIGSEFAYLSLGTWSLMGIESAQPIINEETFADSFTNEGGVNGTIRFLKNITGFWLIEQCIQSWEKQGQKVTYAQIDAEVLLAKPFERFIDCDADDFKQAGDMVTMITNYLIKTNQTIPQTYGEWARCIFESLAMKYRFTLDKLARHASFKIKAIHAIGGGTKNHLLCQLTANATQLPVIAGPVEATASGNILVQALAMKELSSFDDIREVMRNSVETKTYLPTEKLEWETQYEVVSNKLYVIR